MTDEVLLSEEGRARRDAMLGELTGAMRRHHRARRARRRLASTACGLALLATTGLGAALAARGLHRDGGPPDTPRVVLRPTPSTPVAEIRIVETDPTTLERYRVGPRARTVQRIDDAMLVDELHRLGHPTGLVRVGERVYLTAASFATEAAAP